MFDFVNHFLTSVINYREVDRDICLLMNENYLCSKNTLWKSFLLSIRLVLYEQVQAKNCFDEPVISKTGVP